MYRSLITCRNMTAALQIKSVLSDTGISSEVRRLPRSLGINGCGYAVEIHPDELTKAIRQLKLARISPLNVYVTYDGARFIPFKG